MQGGWGSKPALFLTTNRMKPLIGIMRSLDQRDSYWKDKQSVTGYKVSHTNNIIFFPNQMRVYKAREQEVSLPLA